jgi:cysteinyl-tRNA synthetase
MSMDLLGDRFDVHTGGNDNKFPHHEDEIAQSEGYTGHPVVSIWVHGGFLQMGDMKMAKSQGNVLRVPDLVEHGLDPLAYRLLCFGTRYRSEMNFSWDALDGSNARLTGYRRRMQEWAGADGASPPGEADAAKAFESRFREAVTDDLDMPRALVVLDEVMASPELGGAAKRDLVATWDRVLALDLDRLASDAWEPTDEMRDLVRRRDEARAGKDFAQADAIRDQLTAMGLEVMDSPDGTKVRPRA